MSQGKLDWLIAALESRTHKLRFPARVSQRGGECRYEVSDRAGGRTGRLAEAEEPSTPVLDGEDDAPPVPDGLIIGAVDVVVLGETSDGVSPLLLGEPLGICREVGKNEAGVDVRRG